MGRQSYHMERSVKIDELGIEIHFCNLCLQNRPVEDFSIKKGTIHGISNTCKSCIDNKPRNINWNTPENKYKLYRRQYEKNFDKLKEKWKKRDAKFERKLYLSQNRRIAHALKGQGMLKDKHTIEYLGCSIPFLQRWFEFLFTDKMSWDNIGEWHIDHVKPVCSYDLSEKQQCEECFHWTNLQPLMKRDNLVKNGKLDHHMIEQHKQKVQEFLEIKE